MQRGLEADADGLLGIVDPIDQILAVEHHLPDPTPAVMEEREMLSVLLRSKQALAQRVLHRDAG